MDRDRGDSRRGQRQHHTRERREEAGAVDLGRLLGLTLAIALVVAVSTVLFAALLTISMAYVALVATHYVLPAADRLEGRATRPVPT